ncbi:MAG: nitrite/sulfite reductase [Dehalococcoidia bacterium]|nr:nitrite/sulfite reductase [Dehalococcoidia bacterium]
MTTVQSRKVKGVIPYLPEEIDAFEAEAKRFKAGQLPELEFVGFRLKQGVYGQRQLDAQMIRVKVPFGGLTADQLDALGYIADRFAPLRKGHVTTRENFQLHHLRLEDTPEALRILGDVGLTTREACGNTVRNVVACPHAGVSPDEAFDPTPYVGAYARYFVRHPVTQLMPRKLKTAFSCGDTDCAMTAIHDMGLIARVKDGRKGFKIVVGGGTSIMPRLAPTLYEFVPVEDFLRIVEACLRVFNKADELRKNRMRARIKFLVDRVGIDAFRKMVEEELKQPWAKKNIDPTPLLYLDDETADAPKPSTNGHRSNGRATPEFIRWASTNVSPQKQAGYRMVFVTIPQGDLNPSQFSGLATISRDYAGGRCRITQQQGLVFRWVREEHVQDVYEALQALTDVVTCPGTDSCKLGITSSMGVGAAIRETLMNMHIDDPEIRKMHVKASGCPNGCGQHHIAQIGLHGAAMKGPTGQQVPAYEVFIGGNADGVRGPIRFGSRVTGRLPSKRAPEFITKAIEYYTANRSGGESFNAFVDRVGVKTFEPILDQFKEIGPLNRENIHLYMDWSKTIPYRVERGEGECAM